MGHNGWRVGGGAGEAPHNDQDSAVLVSVIFRGEAQAIIKTYLARRCCDLKRDNYRAGVHRVSSGARIHHQLV